MPTNVETDADLLQQFASNGSQAAFEEVVRRNVGLVYGSALRQLRGDSHAAEDIAQTVFVLLSRKAGTIPPNSVAAAWLFTATRYAVSHHLRAQRRRIDREQEAQTMNELNSEPVQDAYWARIKPELDDLVASLGSHERDAILLRFFQGRSLSEVGQQLGISADAARMRIERGLEKLRSTLSKRGVSSSAAAIGAMLTQEAAFAISPTLASSIAATAFSGLSAGSTGAAFLNSVIMAKIKTGLVGALVAGVIVTAVFQERTKAQLRLEIASLDQESNGSAGDERRESAAIAAPERIKDANKKDPGHSDAPKRPRGPSLVVNDPIPGGLVNRGWLPVSALHDAGRADVPSAVETMLWGQAHPETATLASTLWITMVKNPITGKEQWAPTNLTPDSAEVVTAARVSKREPFSEVQVIEQVGAGDNAYVTMQFRTADGRVYQQNRRLHITGDGWKWLPSAEQLAAARTEQ